MRTVGALALLGLSSGTASAQTPTLRPTAATPPVSRPATPPAARPATPPAARPATPPAARPATPPAVRPTPPAARPTTPAARPTPTPRPVAPPADVGPPPSLPDLGPPPSLPSTDPSPTPDLAPTPSTGPSPQRPAPPPTVRPSAPPPIRPTAPPPTSTPIPEPAVPVAPPPVVVEAPPPAPGSPVPPTSSPVPPASSPPVADSALRAPSIGGDDLAPASAAAKPITIEDIEALAEKRAAEERKNPKKWRHGGLVFDLQIGTAMCFRQFCRSDTGHHAAPGVHLGGFFGGNVLGILELGLEAGWNTLRPRDVTGRNAVTLYGLDPVLLQQEIAQQQGVANLEVDFSTLIVDTAKSRALNVGPSLRIHFIRKGRGLAYIGTGIHYQLWRNRYTTAGGDLRLDFHGISAPFKVGGGAYVHPNIAVTGEFTYSLAMYVLGGVNHPDLSAVAPISIIESSTVNAGASLTKGLPHFGKFSVNLRFRF
ncbi:hypothetical protein [Nannocystis sp.]|uniref:hypothetical protein n=1 Tax=Nannocystis sp. TaxID=1962667 RepID=UPI0025EDB0AA|nr:hypothetical protein [Nannocystis sp.]MBK7824465.1 hypothetical protein [Nannocystis sp.]